MKTVAQKIKEAINRKGFTTVKECAQTLGLPYELLRKVVGEDHIPKDNQLLIYARKLGIDPKELLFTAYHQKAPAEFKEYFEMKVIREAPRVTNSIPLIDWTQVAGFISGSNSPVSVSEYFQTNLQGNQLFAISVIEGSMRPFFNEGEILIVASDAQAMPGDYVIVQGTADKVVLRQLKKYGSTTVLHPANLHYDDSEMTKDMRIVGKVIRKQIDY